MENLDSVNNITAKEKDLEFRCPQCFKLYRVNQKHIHSNQPQFECQSCHANFVFDYPPKNAKALYTRLVDTKSLSLPQVGKLSTVEGKRLSRKSAEFRECPKCQTMNPRGVSECYKCGIVFQKAEMIQQEARNGGLPSLIKLWHELLHDYTNLTKHMQFVDRCEEMHALPFALKKYNELKEVQPQDSLASQMLNSVLMKSLSRRTSQVVDSRFLSFLKQIPYGNIFRLVPLALSLSLILVGVLGHGKRNFAGGGVAFLVMILGFIYVTKGRISWRSFWH